MEITIIILLYLIAAKGKISVNIGLYTYFRICVREAIKLIPSNTWQRTINHTDMINIGLRQLQGRKRTKQMLASWLVFEFAYRVTELTEVGKIYPKNYEAEGDPTADEKMKELQATEYFD